MIEKIGKREKRSYPWQISTLQWVKGFDHGTRLKRDCPFRPSATPLEFVDVHRRLR